MRAKSRLSLFFIFIVFYMSVFYEQINGDDEWVRLIVIRQSLIDSVMSVGLPVNSLPN